MKSGLSRRAFLGRAVLGGAAASVVGAFGTSASAGPLSATRPAGFTPMEAPGRVIRVSSTNTMQPNALWPTQEAASKLVDRAMLELTRETDLSAAWKHFVHPEDKIAIKMNGLAGRFGASMATNKETLLAIVQGIVGAGVPASSITLYEQFEKFMIGTRVADGDGNVDDAFPKGVKANIHKNTDATMDPVTVAGKDTRYVRALTEATCVINVGLIKDHSIWGYTGCLKNLTHGSIVNPGEYHESQITPQIAKLYAHDIVRSRVRLHLTDGFKVIYDGGPQDAFKNRRVLYESVLASTDPVAMDVIGCEVVERLRKENNLPTLADAGRDPQYIQVAGMLGIGISDRSSISLREFSI